MMKFKHWAFILLLLILTPLVHAQEDLQEDLSQQAANPLADLMSFPFQNNLNLNQGEFNRNTNVLNIQPVFPFAEAGSSHERSSLSYGSPTTAARREN
jgi:hypothetical protein